MSGLFRGCTGKLTLIARNQGHRHENVPPDIVAVYPGLRQKSSGPVIPGDPVRGADSVAGRDDLLLPCGGLERDRSVRGTSREEPGRTKKARPIAIYNGRALRNTGIRLRYARVSQRGGVDSNIDDFRFSVNYNCWHP